MWYNNQVQAALKPVKAQFSRNPKLFEPHLDTDETGPNVTRIACDFRAIWPDGLMMFEPPDAPMTNNHPMTVQQPDTLASSDDDDADDHADDHAESQL